MHRFIMTMAFVVFGIAFLFIIAGVYIAFQVLEDPSSIGRFFGEIVHGFEAAR